MKGPPTEAALLKFGMERLLVRLILVDEERDPVECFLIVHPPRQTLVMLDFAVEFGTLVAHGGSVFPAAN